MAPQLHIGITRGDSKGIGPEITDAACAALASDPTLVLHIYGEQIPDPDQLTDREAGQLSAAAIAAAVEDAMTGRIDAIVTAPINKTRWQTAGVNATGHTEWLATCAQTTTPLTPLFCSPRWRIALVTGHMPLAAVAEQITPGSIARATRQTVCFLQDQLKIANPRLACLGLNPHAGEAGLLGHEEREIIIPTLEALRARGIDITGPSPADTFFAHYTSLTDDGQRTTDDGFHAVIAMYHDQGLIPIKTLDPWGTVQVTMGLPFIRTSPAHGTAEDIAGTGQANADGMIAAVQLACTLCHCEEQTK